MKIKFTISDAEAVEFVRLGIEAKFDGSCMKHVECDHNYSGFRIIVRDDEDQALHLAEEAKIQAEMDKHDFEPAKV